MRALLTQPYVLVFVGGGIGSLLRYLAGRFIPATLAGISFPTSILLINSLASGLLGIVSGWALTRIAGEDVRLLVGVGFCGGLSTFSSFSYDTAILIQNGRLWVALLTIILNVTICLIASFSGLYVGQKI
ncbi:fluoride efflux transporter CrcB [Spirosoma terrae]|uniref:Fluoride-specific ion channel FluC n=1 Tax=Spirosoma terrae TaxID=1968276 RepID=A0A6L9L3F3_9BACT|nr:fluoride efflux transporter CrcB [Spirosoma terrae]NDU93303.1 fluoride efflux transporter CrcB [Spirosoma terrae]